MSGTAADSDLPLPWLDNPAPTSCIQPGITRELKTFRVNKWYFPTHYPYRMHGPQIRGSHTQIRTVPFFLFGGLGSPPNDIGYPGDIYRDTTARDYTLYARFKNTWVPWTGVATAGEPIHEHSNLLHHPNLTAHFLWCTDSGITWMWCEEILKDASNRCIGLPASLFDVNALLAQSGWPGQATRKRKNNPETTMENERTKKSKIPGTPRLFGDLINPSQSKQTLVNINIPYSNAEVRHLYDVSHDYQAKFHLADSRRLEVEKELLKKCVQIRALEKEVKTHKLISEQRAASMQNLKRENRRLAAYPAKVQMLETEVAKLRAAGIEVTTKSEQAVKILETQKLELNAQVARLEGESTALRQDYALSNLNLRRMTEEMVKVDELNERLKEKARGSVANSNLLKSENKRLEQGVSRMKEQATQAREKLGQSEKKLENTRVDLETKGRDLRRLEREVTSQTAENKNLTHANLTLRAELDNLEERNHNALEENLRLREDLAREIQVLDQIRDKIAGKVEEETLLSTNHSERLRMPGEVIQVGLNSGSRMDPEQPLKSEEKNLKEVVKEESS